MENNIRNFAFIAGNDVFTMFSVEDDGQPLNNMLIAGFNSRPVVVEAPNGVRSGHKYIDGVFYAPINSGSQVSGPGYEVEDD